jgi:hypothetical protein
MLSDDDHADGEFSAMDERGLPAVGSIDNTPWSASKLWRFMIAVPAVAAAAASWADDDSGQSWLHMERRRS